MKIRLISYTDNPITVMYVAARTCYSSTSPLSMLLDYGDYEKKRDFVFNVLKSGHLSIAEHITFTFAIEGISRACSHQLVRHRHCTFSQQSQRYVDMGNPDFIVPEGLQRNEYEKIGELLNHARDVYNFLTSNGVKKEDARCILPNCTPTNIVMTCNLRELMHMCDLRLCTRAQKEIRDLFKAIKEEVKCTCSKEIADLLQPQCEHLGYCPEHNSCGRKQKR